MNAKIELQLFKEKIEKLLEKYLTEQTEKAEKVSPYCGEMLNNVKDMTMRGGKRIRAAILYYSYLAFGGKDKERAMKVAMSMELMQTYLLVHDDIIDSDDMRRGGLSMHKTYENICEERYAGKTNPKSFGNSVAILAGDVACALSNKIIAESGFSDRSVVRAIIELNHMYTKEVNGEFLDTLSELRDDIAKEDVILTHQLKTVPYTFDSPLKIGAMLAGANDKTIEKINEYTVPLGVAFQIQDDILGMFGTEEKLGKPVTSDLREGKRTLLVLDALMKASESEKQIISSALGNKRINISDVNKVRQIIRDTGALEKSQDTATAFVKESMSALDKLKLKKEGKEFLLGIAEYMIKREY